MNAETTIAEKPPSRTYAWFVLAMMVALYLVNVADRYVASGLLEEIKRSFEVPDWIMGLLVGPAFAVVYTLLAIPIALLADRSNRVRIIVAGAIIWSGFTILSGLAQTPWTFAAARLGVGIGEAAFLAPAFSLLSDYFPPKKRAFAFAVLNFGVYFGQVSGLIGGATIAEIWDWRIAFIALGAPGILLGILTLLFVREPKRGQMDGLAPSNNHIAGNQASNTGKANPLRDLSIVWASRAFRNMTFGVAFGGFASYGFGIWAPTLFARAFELSLTDANIYYGGPSFLAGLLGALILGFICDRLTARNSRWPFRLSAIGLTGFFITMIILCFTQNITFATALTFPAGLMAGGWVIAQQAALQDLLPAKARATATALWAFFLTFSGMALGVAFVGFASDLLTGSFGDQSIRYAMALVLLANLPAIGFILRAGNFVDADRERLHQQIS